MASSPLVDGTAQDAGECQVNLNTDTLTVQLRVREPLAIAPQTVTLGVYDFLSIFGAVIMAAGNELVKKSREAASRIGRSH